MSEGENHLFLEGVRVLDFTQFLPGPFATKRLADMGAQVIKIEPPQGDPARRLGRTEQETGIVFLANNEHKQSIYVNLKSAADRERVMQIAATVDVVLEGFRPGVAERLGIGFEQIRKINPSIIYCSLTGYGQPPNRLAHLAGHDLNYVARSGLLTQLTDRTGQPIVPNFQFADLIGGLVAEEAILAALVNKQRTGKGAYLDVAMLAALQGMLHIHAMAVATNGVEDGMEETTGKYVCYNLYSTQDGRMVTLAALEEKFWKNFCLAVNEPNWIDKQYSPAVEYDPVYQQIRELFQQRTMKEWSELGEQADCCLQPALTIQEAFYSQDYS